MEARPKATPSLKLTPAAVAHIQKAMQADPQVCGVRIQWAPGGCSGWRFAIGLVSSSNPKERVIFLNSIPVFFHEALTPHLTGLTLDYQSRSLEEGFTFQTSSGHCPCGKSVACSSL